MANNDEFITINKPKYEGFGAAVDNEDPFITIPKSTKPPVEVNLPTIVKTPDPVAEDIYKYMPHLGLDPITQGMMPQPEGGWNEFGVPAKVSPDKSYTPGASLTQTKDESLVDKISGWWHTPKVSDSKASNIMAMSKITGLSPTETLRNYDALSASMFPGSLPESAVGRAKLIGKSAMDVGILAGLITHPLPTAVALGTFFGLDELENAIVSKFTSNPYQFQGGRGLADLLSAEGLSRDALDLLDFAWKIPAAGSTSKIGRGLLGNIVQGTKDKATKIDIINKVAEKVKETGNPPDKVIIDDIDKLGIDPETLKKAHDEVLKMEDIQRQLSPDMFAEWIKEDLEIKGSIIKQIKQPKKTIADEVINRAMEKLPDEEFVTIKKPLKEDVTFIGMQEGINGELFPLVNDKNKSTITYDPEKHNIVNKEDFVKESHGIEMEPITDLDLLTGTREPLELSTERSPFRESTERTLQMKEMYEANADKINRDVEMATSKLINDVNRWLDGDETIPIDEVRDQLSTFASRGEELKSLFSDRYKFDTWKKTVEEAAKWARNSDRLKIEQSGIKLTMGIDPKDIVDIGRKLKPFYSKLEEVVKQKLGGKVEVEQMKKMLENSGVSKDEIKNLVGGLEGKVSKQDVLDEIKSNMTEFEDVILKDTQVSLDEYAQYFYKKSFAELNTDQQNDIVRNTKNKLLDTHFESYTEPGAVPESYREMFVTAPKASEGKVPTQIEVDNAYERYSNSLDKTGKSEDTHKLYLDWDNLRKQREDRPLKWQDGHSQYSDIQNPIVRIRYNEREVNGKRILFIEEFQGPSKDNQSKMPDYLQKRIYDIGVKRVIALAKEQGFDGIAWTTGEMQASRYDLSKHIEGLGYGKNPDGTYNIDYIPKGGSKENAQILKSEVPVGELQSLVGKDLAKKILEGGNSGTFNNIDLKVGGEGLKYLYDKQIPSLMKKYGKGEIETIEAIPKTIPLPSDTMIRAREGETILEAEDRMKLDWLKSKGMNLESVQFIPITPKTPSTFSMYSGFPIDEASKAIIEGAKRLSAYTKKARGMKEFKPTQAYKMLKEEFNRSFVDRSGNIRKALLDTLGDEGYRIVQKMYLSKGASSISANMLKQMRKEVYDGLNSNEKRILDNLILSDRMLDIGRYKTETQFKFPEGLKPVEAAAYNELFRHNENIDEATASKLKQRAKSYYEWMKKPLKDMFDNGLISEEEYNNLVSHNYRRLKLVEVFDKKYETKVGNKKRTVYDSGVQALAHGRETDIFEPSSEIMALEVFNRAYGRILNNEANLELLNLARANKDNPFVRYKETRGDKIPSGWNRFFVYEGGERKSIYLSPEMSKEWITNSPELSYKMGQVLRYTSGSPILRTFATGIDWGFALANLPRDIMHTWFAARTFEDGKWKSVYSPHFPIFGLQIGKDQLDVFSDALLRKGRYEDYIKEGGGMEFLVHQGRLFQRGRHIEGNIDKAMDFLGYFGETSEIMTRLAIRDRVIKNRAKERGISYEEAKKNKDITREATFAARDYMDFGQGGGIAKALDNAIPYLNASIQGSRGLFRSAKDNPLEFTYKLSQFASVVTGLYIAANATSPETMKNLKGNIDMQNNLCIPLGDWSSFIDEKGQTRYLYFKIPLDPGQRFFKTFFEASTDKWLGNPVDVDAIVNSLEQVSPVGTSSLPPTIAGTFGYVMNKDFWRNEDIWRKTDKPLNWPGSKEEYIPGRTPQQYIDVGKVTGLSPERTKYAVEQLITSGSMWSWMVGQGYDAAFGELPKDKNEKHLAEVLSKIPVIKRFIGITNPYSQYVSTVDRVKDERMMQRWVENRGLDTLVEGFLYKDNVTKSEVYKYMRSFKDADTYDRLEDRFEFSQAIKNLPNRSFWLSLKGIPDTEGRAKVFMERMNNASEKEKSQIRRELSIVENAGGIYTDAFIDELNKLRRTKSPQQ